MGIGVINSTDKRSNFPSKIYYTLALKGLIPNKIIKRITEIDKVSKNIFYLKKTFKNI